MKERAWKMREESEGLREEMGIDEGVEGGNGGGNEGMLRRNGRKYY